MFISIRRRDVLDRIRIISEAAASAALRHGSGDALRQSRPRRVRRNTRARVREVTHAASYFNENLLLKHYQ